MTETPWAGMNPNSEHQVWGRWEFTIDVHHGALLRTRSFEEVKNASIQFFVRLFRGKPAEMKIAEVLMQDAGVSRYKITLRVEDERIIAEDYCKQVGQKVTDFFRTGFRCNVNVRLNTKLEAGRDGSGKPAPQLIVVPMLKMDLKLNGE